MVTSAGSNSKAPLNSNDPKPGMWSSVMTDKPYDEFTDFMLPSPPVRSPSSSPKNLREAWWSMVIASGTFSEEEISSIDSIPAAKSSLGVEKDADEKVVSKEDCHDADGKLQAKTDRSSKEREYPEDEEEAFQCCFSGGNTQKILDIVQQNTCSYDTINSPVISKLEETCTDPALWKLLDPHDFEEFEDWSPSDEERESFDAGYPLKKPVATNISEMTEEILKDMENDFDIIRQKAELSGTKYKNILSQRTCSSSVKTAKSSKSASGSESGRNEDSERAVTSSDDVAPTAKQGFNPKKEVITPKTKTSRLVHGETGLHRKETGRNEATSLSETDNAKRGSPWKKGCIKPKVNMTRMATGERNVLKEDSEVNATTSSVMTGPAAPGPKKEPATSKAKAPKLFTGEAEILMDVSKQSQTALTDENHADKRGSPWKRGKSRKPKLLKVATEEAGVLKEVSKHNVATSSEERPQGRGRFPPLMSKNAKPKPVPPEEDESTKPSYIPSTVAVEDDNLASPTRLVNGMSNLTVDSVKTDASSWNQSFHDENQSKTCFSPSFQTFQKRLGMLNRLKLKKKSSKSTTTGTSTSHTTGGTLPTVRVLPKSGSEAVELGVESTSYEYDYDSTSHTYIAYFNRGERARSSFRMYDHQTPPCFPTLGSEIVVRVEVSTVSSSDCAVRRGDWWGEGSRHPLNLPIVPGTSFCGTIVQIDKASSRHGLHKGDRVTSLVRVGANTRHLFIDSDRVVKVPSELTDEIAVACLAEIYLAAFQALHLGQKNAARYRKTSLSGKSVLVLDGATAQGRALVELAVAAGASTVFATGRERQFGMIEDAGGLPLNKNPNHWFALLKGRIDLVLGHESVCSQLDVKYEHIQSLNPTGKLILIGSPDQEEKTVITLDNLDKQSIGTSRKLYNFNIFDSWDEDIKQGKRDLTHLLKLLQDGSVKPRILDRIGLNKVANAQDLIESRKLSGFILCEPWIKCSKDESAVVDTAEKKIYSEAAESWTTKGPGKILAIPSDELDVDGQDDDSLLHMV